MIYYKSFTKIDFRGIAPKKLDNIRMIWYNTYDTTGNNAIFAVG